MQSLSKTISKILGMAFLIAAVAAFASFHLMSRRVLREAEAEAALRAKEILNGQMADLTRMLHEGREVVIRLRGEIFVANYRYSNLAIGVYTRERSPIYESASEFDLGRFLLKDGERSAIEGGRAFAWKPIELGRETLGHVVVSTAIDKSEEVLIARSLLVSVLALVVAMGIVYVLSRAAIRRAIIEPIEQINHELPRLQKIVDGDEPIRTAVRPDRSGASDRVNRSATEIASLRGALFDFSLRLRASAEAHRHVESELSRSQAIHGLARQTGHDIRSPLAALEAVLLSGTAISEDRVRILRLAVKRIQGIAAHLLSLEKSHEPDTPPAPLTFGLVQEVVGELIEEKCVMAPPGIEVTFLSNLEDVRPGALVGSSEVSADDFRRVMANLLSNALEAVTAPGQVAVVLELDSQELRILIKDSGCGIPSEHLGRVFERGFTHGKISGHGLGLSYVKDRVSTWHGRVDLKSEVGHGTTIEIRLSTLAASALSIAN